jgi:hypothetical protein
MIGRKQAIGMLLAADLMFCGLAGCAQNKSAAGTSASANPPEKSSETKNLTPEEKRFNNKVAGPAEQFAQKSQEIYASGKEPPKPWWTVLWPWGQEKKSEKPKMDLKKFNFTATYPNAKK